MGKNLATTLKRLQKRIRKLEKALVALPAGVDDVPIMRIYREELGEKALAVTVLSESYLESELSMARRVARVLTARRVQREPPSVKDPSPQSGLSMAEIYLLIGGLSVPSWHRPSSPYRKKSVKRRNSFRTAAVRKYLESLGIKKVTVRIRGKKAYIIANKSVIVKMAKRLDRIKKKMRSFGISEVLLRLLS